MSRHAEQIEEQNHEQADHDPKKQVLDPGIHPDLLRANVTFKQKFRYYKIGVMLTQPYSG
jgi:hypothetical protein